MKRVFKIIVILDVVISFIIAFLTVLTIVIVSINPQMPKTMNVGGAKLAVQNNDAIKNTKNPLYSRSKHRFPYLFNYLLVKNKLDSLLDLDDGDGGGDYAISCYRFLKTFQFRN